MNILYLQASNTIGGAEISLLNQVKYLQSKGISSIVILPPHNNDRLGTLLKSADIRVFYLEVPANRAKVRLKGWRKIINYFYRRLKAIKNRNALDTIVALIKDNNIDIVHTNTVHTSAGFLAAKRLKVPHVQHLREITGFSSESIVQLKGQQNAARFRKKWGTHDGLIANSNYCLDSNRPWFEGKKELVLYNAVAPQPSSTKRADSTPIIGLVANVTSRVKRHSHFLKIAAAYAAKYNTPITFHIYGKLPADRNDVYFKALQEEVIQLEIGDYLKFKDTVPASEIYSEITCLIHTYPNESFGRIFIEAMAAGVPVLTWRGGGASELIDHKYDGFLYEEGNIEAIVKTLNLLLNNADLYQRITENGRTKAKEFTPDVVFKALPNFYASLIN